MNVENPDNLAIHVHVCPLCAVVGLLKINLLLLHNRIATVDDHVVAPECLVREILAVKLGIGGLAHIVVVFLQAQDIYLLLFHRKKNVLGNEA